MARNLGRNAGSREDGRPLLSLAMIVRNEEATLPGCLEAARDAVDEIVIVDTGSTDRTVEIATSFGARVAHFEWCDDFSAARNAALDLVTARWVLHLDADEELDGARELRSRVEHLGHDTWTVELPIVSLQDPQHRRRDLASFQKRIFRSEPQIRFERPIHEEIVNPRGGRRDRWDQPVIWHSGYADSEARRAKIIERNLPILRKAFEEDPRNPVYALQLALLQSDVNKTLSYYESALRMLNPEQRKSELFHMATIRLIERLSEAGRPNEAIMLGADLLRADATPDVAALTGQLLVRAGQLERAETVLRIALELPASTTSHFILGSSTWLPRLTLGELERRRGRFSEGAAWVKQAAALDPPGVDLQPRLAVLHAMAGDWGAAARALGMPARTDRIELLERAALRAIEDGDAPIAADAYRALQKMRNEPGDALALARLFATAGVVADAVSLLRSAVERFPGNAGLWLEMALIEEGAGRHHEALAAAEKAIEIDADLLDAWLLKARSLGEMLDWRGASESAARAIALDPSSTDAIVQRTRALARLQDLQEAYDLIYPFATAHPENVAFASALSDVLNYAGEYDEAVNVLAQAIDREPDDPDLYVTLGRLLGRVGRYQDALNAREVALSKGAKPSLLNEAMKLVLQAMGRAGVEVPSPVQSVFRA